MSFSLDRERYMRPSERLFILLSAIADKPQKKFALMCVLETNTPSLNRILSDAIEYGLIYKDAKLFRITQKGKNLLEVWHS